jgi:enoyl-CoA hydratase
VDYRGYEKAVVPAGRTDPDDHVNNPDALNSTAARCTAELARVFTELADDEQCDVAILTGAGKAFSAGAASEGMQRMIDEPMRFESPATRTKRIVFSMLDCPKPIIAKVNGHAIGLGATMALLQRHHLHGRAREDRRSARQGGYVAGDGGAVIWPQLLGYAKAKEYLLTGTVADRQEAEKIGSHQLRVAG